MKRNVINFRLSDTDLLVLEKMSKVNNVTYSDYIRNLMKLDYDSYISFGDFIEKQNEEIKCYLFEQNKLIEKRHL